MFDLFALRDFARWELRAWAQAWSVSHGFLCCLAPTSPGWFWWGGRTDWIVAALFLFCDGVLSVADLTIPGDCALDLIEGAA